MKATVLTRDGAVVHPNFISASRPSPTPSPPLLQNRRRQSRQRRPPAEPQAAPVKTGAPRPCAQEGSGQESRSAGHGRYTQEGRTGRCPIGARRNACASCQESAGQARQEGRLMSRRLCHRTLRHQPRSRPPASLPSRSPHPSQGYQINGSNGRTERRCDCGDCPWRHRRRHRSLHLPARHLRARRSSWAISSSGG